MGSGVLMVCVTQVLHKMCVKGRSKQSHLKDLLIRLDFNGYYERQM